MIRVAIRGGVAAREALAVLPGVAAVEVEETRRRNARPRSTARRTATRARTSSGSPSQKGWVLRELGREAMTLEDVFVRLTRHDEAVPAEEPVAAEPSSRLVAARRRRRGAAS